MQIIKICKRLLFNNKFQNNRDGDQNHLEYTRSSPDMPTVGQLFHTMANFRQSMRYVCIYLIRYTPDCAISHREFSFSKQTVAQPDCQCQVKNNGELQTSLILYQFASNLVITAIFILSVALKSVNSLFTSVKDEC